MTPELQQENSELRRRLRALMSQARHNELVMRRFQEQELRLIGAGSFEELLDTLLERHREIFALDAVSLALDDPGYELRRVLSDLEIGLERFPGLIFLGGDRSAGACFGADPQPILGHFDKQHHQHLFPSVHADTDSVALLPLVRHGRLIGSFNLVSRSGGRFIRGQATDFLQRLSAVVAICLENATNYERLKYLGLTDPLTGVRNRRYFEQRVSEELGRVHRQGAALSCLMLDIDHFKQINDRFGHPSGDIVLQQIADRIRTQLRCSDALARYGGEEFSALLVQTEESLALGIAERIRCTIADRCFVLGDGHSLSLTVSIGVASVDGSAGDDPLLQQMQSLVQSADQALYRAKQGGRNRVVSHCSFPGDQTCKLHASVRVNGRS